MSARRHLSPHEFGPVHEWLQSPEGENWSRSTIVGTEDYHDAAPGYAGIFTLRDDNPDDIEGSYIARNPDDVIHNAVHTAWRPHQELPYDAKMAKRAHP